MCEAVWNGTRLWFLVWSQLKQRWLWQQCFINPFLTMSAISCLNMNGMIGTSHSNSSKEKLFFTAFSPFSSTVPFSCYLPPPVSQSLDWVLMMVTAGHLGRPQSQLGGSVIPARYPLWPLLSVLSCPIWDQPPSCLARSSPPKHRGLLLLTQVYPLRARPSPLSHCSTLKCAPPLHSLLFVRAGPVQSLLMSS